VLLNSSAHTVNARLDVRLALQLHMAFDRVCVVVLLHGSNTHADHHARQIIALK
jgi:hypothetical protein